ncbi:hypothetical protein K470DRAFT_270027 [Piedraia hortae CBS 480.64]|uniref:Mitochondrial cytochrome c oxidase assembly factor n=1 Tax=Piedraia hortae CBS 480.64 TaxID=1314780 RepID=A0A6A7C1Q5_9PEZI|nr:hypothetical protein K470DRAFT_270027 [Piedraia hortae CBS 480.64]
MRSPLNYLRGGNLEVLKFGLYIMFPIGIMYYFGTNLESRFSIPNFWPKPEQTNKIPFEKDEIEEELARLRERRLRRRAKRLESEATDKLDEITPKHSQPFAEPEKSRKGWLGW